MGDFGQILGLFDTAGERAVDRAIAEYRAGRPVAILEGGEALVALNVEALDARVAAALDTLAPGRARLALPAARLRRLGLDRTQPGIVAFPVPDAARAETLALKIDARIDAPVAPVVPLDEAALELARVTMVTPAVYVIPVEKSALGAGIATVDAADIRDYRASQVKAMKIVGRAPVPLEFAAETEFVVFRGGEGLRDQVAIIVGKPDLSKPVAIRMHSACLTGDLFGSLKCDCGDQLRGTVQKMAESDGGILLYLDQEGRGNGISNKMRAYKLQSQGWDTYDADEVLGFGLDQRRFDFAAVMLRQLGVSTVRVMTNNPEKIGALKAAGLEVVADQRAFGRQTAENIRYLASKRDRAGHFIDFDAMVAHAPVNG
ncbi:MAG: GTP cyclohydrolase II RibA [Proteobacteria bacterium]|nr:GTP cyclohydrolase II RibA [Pseudomonadota bacterium]